MGILALFNHVVNLLAPAFWLAAGLTLLARLTGKKRSPAWLVQFALNLTTGVVTLGLGLVWQGNDGKMLTYIALVLVCGTSQWFMLRR